MCGSRQVITLPRVRARVTGHVVLERGCPKCRKRWAPEPDWGALSVGRQRFGVSVQRGSRLLLVYGLSGRRYAIL